MENLTIETGVVNYSLNDCCTVSFNPTDIAFVGRLFRAFSALEAQQEQYRAETAKLTGKEAYLFADERDKEMRETINGVFGVDVCTPLFGDMNVYALSGGLPVWANLMLTIIDTLDAALVREQKAYNPKIEKYTKKYHK